MQYKGFTLDQFQIDSVDAINRGNSVIVSAATGTGKTLIADYVIDKHANDGKIIIYTAPIKALSNQKFKEFKESFGASKVGILTGDVVINPKGRILVMTTEIYRNMLLARDDLIQNVSYVVFDEIHYINDIERGTIWEESIIFSPKHIRFLCLSATIPNAKEFARWIETIKQHRVEVVKYEKRAVPLNHMVFDYETGLSDAKALGEVIDIPEYHMSNRLVRRKQRTPEPEHYELIKQIRDKLPAIYFLFSRKECERKANDLSKRFNFTTKESIHDTHELTRNLSPEVKRLQSTQHLLRVLGRGVAYHHAGVLPPLKELVETLFEKGHIKVLYATETFAVGINMPAKTVCFNSLFKYDGVSFRPLNSKEYFQLAGRAGRRGIDKVGYAITRVSRRDFDLKKYIQISTKDVEPIRSQFTLSFNTVLNLVNNHSDVEIDKILKSNFDYYVRKSEGKNVRIKASFNHKRDQLVKLGYVDRGYLTDKGTFAVHIYQSEVLLSELFATGLCNDLTPTEINILIAAVIYEERRQDFFTWKGSSNTYKRLLDVIDQNQFVSKNLNKKNMRRMIRVVSAWSTDCPFESLPELCNLAEGDLIRLFRRIIDVLRQIRRASPDEELIRKINVCITSIDRDLVEVKL